MFTLYNPAPAKELSIYGADGEKLVVINLLDGTVVVHHKNRVDEAAQLFWQAVSRHAPGRTP